MSVPCLLYVALVAHAAPSHDIVPDDQFTLDDIGGLDVNTNGTTVVFVRTRWDKASDGRVDDLWTVDTRTRATERLTFLNGSVQHPIISPDDTWVYFESGDDNQVWRLPLSGGTPAQLTHVDGGVQHVRLSADGGAIWYVTTSDEHVEDGWDAMRKTWSDLEYAERKVSRSVVHRLDLSSWRTEDVWTPGAYVVDLAIADDNVHLAAITAPDADLIDHEGGTAVTVLDRSTGAVQTLPDDLWRANAPSPRGWLHGISWAGDSRALAFRIDFDGFPGETFVTEFAGDVPNTWALPRPGGVTAVGSSAAWVPGTRDLCYRAVDKARVRILCVPRVRGGSGGKLRAFPPGDTVVDSYAFSGDGRDIIAVVGTPSHFPEVYRLPARGNLFPQQLTDLNPQTAEWKLPDLNVVTWTAPDGSRVEGILETPAGWTKADGPLPLVVQVHGGPTGFSAYALSFGASGRTAFAAQGWALLSPNYRGSMGYGDDYLAGLVGRENEVEVADILAGVDAMVADGVADPERLAVMGWSNGGFLTAALIAATDRFKAASLGAGVVDQTMQWALEDTPGHVINFMQGQPWTAADAYRTASPLLFADRIHTPTLIHHGADDGRVPLAHAEALFRALDTYLHVPVELVVYPGMGHGLSTLSARAAKSAWDHAWFDRWVKQAKPAAPVAAAP